MFKTHTFSIRSRARLGLFGLDKSGSQVIDLEGSVNFMKFNGIPSGCALACGGDVCQGDQPHPGQVGLALSRSPGAEASSASPVSSV